VERGTSSVDEVILPPQIKTGNAQKQKRTGVRPCTSRREYKERADTRK